MDHPVPQNFNPGVCAELIETPERLEVSTVVTASGTVLM